MAVKRRVFFSFHYEADAWRAAQIRNAGVVEGNEPLTDNQWEEVVGGGDDAISAWIDNQLSGKSCAIVLIGSKTAGRKWIDYEIRKAWSDGRALLGIYVHKLKDRYGNQAQKGKNPFDRFQIGGTSLATIVRAYDPPYYQSTDVYAFITENIANWVEEAILIRSNY